MYNGLKNSVSLATSDQKCRALASICAAVYALKSRAQILVASSVHEGQHRNLCSADLHLARFSDKRF
jgi:hypothetical protein